MNELLHVEDLAVSFPTKRAGERIHAVDGVSFALREGETLGLIGESGSGKSTLSRALLQLIRPTDGKIHLASVDLATRRVHTRREVLSRMQMVFQDPSASLDPRMRILSSVEEPLVVQRRGNRATRRARALATLESVGLSAEHGERYPHELSGGQKQRANIARALVLDPALVVCDEPVSALDVALQAEILDLLRKLQAELGLSYLFITHDLAVVSNIANRVAVMYLGRLMELGPVNEVVERPLHPYTEALVSAQPRIEIQQRDRIVLEGDIPSPVNPPSGCRFRTRCRYAQETCALETPEWREVEPGRWSACHFAGSLPLHGVEGGES